MKYVKRMKSAQLLAIFLSVLLVGGVNANEVVELPKSNFKPRVETVCLHGFLFAIATTQKGNVSLVQIFKDGKYWDAPLDPIKCR